MNLLEIFERIMGRNDLRGKHAVITGAASGIGRALALNLANEGCRLALADIDSDGLNETAEEAREYGIYVSTHMVDVSDLEQVKLFVNAVIKKHAVVDIVINNAGITIFETLEDVTYEDFERIIDINLWGVIYGCKEFIPYLKKQRSANIVNICSVNGIFTNPNNGPYCTSKFAVRGFTETLIQELSDTNIKVSCVFPGAIKTNIINNAKFYKASKNLPKEKIAKKFNEVLAITTAEKAARIIIAGIKKNKPRILIGSDAYLYDWLKRLFPIGIQKLINKLSRGR